MTEKVAIELEGKMESTAGDTEQRGLQKILQQVRSGAGAALIVGALSSRKPWTQFVTTDNFKAPASMPRLTRRLRRNMQYFQANYLVIFLGLFAYCLITTPILLIAMVASFFVHRRLTAGPNTLKIFGCELTKGQQYMAAAIFSGFLCWLAGAGAVLFWVLGATVTVVALHASLYDADTLPVEADQFPDVDQVIITTV